MFSDLEDGRSIAERVRDFHARMEQDIITKMKSGNYSRGQPTSLGNADDVVFYPYRTLSFDDGLMDMTFQIEKRRARNAAHFNRGSPTSLVTMPRAWPGLNTDTSPLRYETVGFSDSKASIPSTHNSSTPTPNQPQKGNIMTKIDATILVHLAQGDTKDEFCQNLASMPPQLREALEEQREQDSKEIYAKAAKLILAIYKDADERVSYHVQTIRKAREAEQAAKAKIEKIKRAKAYAEATSNYLPLAVLVGAERFLVRGNNGAQLTVPDDWVYPAQIRVSSIGL